MEVILTASLTSAESKNDYVFYKDYTAPMPSGDFAIMHARAFGPSVYLILALTEKKGYIYSPYQRNGLLYTHPITQDEYDKAVQLMNSEAARAIPESDLKPVLDAFEFRAIWSVDDRKHKFHHIQPENETVLEIYKLYDYYRDIQREHSRQQKINEHKP